jgi:tetratricopeptide (TPR) repeat protein
MLRIRRHSPERKIRLVFVILPYRYALYRNVTVTVTLTVSLSTMVCDGNDWTAPVPATQVMKGTSHLIRSRRVWTRSRCWLVALSVAFVVASSACAFVGAVNDNVADEIVVGEHTYRTPFSQYPPLVAKTLLSRPVDNSSEEGPDDMFFQADWLLLLGMAHRRTLEEQVVLTEADFQEISRSVNALQQSVALIEHIRDEYPIESLNAALRQAEVYVNIGETYNLSPDDDEYKLAMDYFVLGEDFYRQALEGAEASVWGNGKDAEVSLEEVEIRWGHCCHRIGVTLVTMSQEISETSDLDESLLTDPEKSQEIMASRNEKMQANLLNAEEYLRKAVTIFSRIAKEESKNTKKNDSELEQVDRHLARSLSNLGTALTMMGRLDEGIEYSELALDLYQKLCHRLPKGDIVADDAIMDIAAMMYALAEQHLQIGKYEKAKQHYSTAMEWNVENNVSPPEELAFYGAVSELDEAIDAHEGQLEAYNVLKNVEMDIEVSDYEGEEDQIYRGKDDLYEGDIHVNLGSMFLAKGDLVSAESHLNQAIKLYVLSLEDEDRNLGDAKFNMAVLKYRTGEYALSREFYDSALDIYRDVVGGGVDPRMVGMDASEVPRVSPRAPAADKKAEVQAQSEAKKLKATIHEDWVDLDDVKDMRTNATIREEL